MSKKPHHLVATLRDFSKQYSGATRDLLSHSADEIERLHKAGERLAWLHRGGPNDAAGCEWGIFRVLWDGNGQPVAVSQTLSDFSDLDAEMQRNP